MAVDPSQADRSRRVTRSKAEAGLCGNVESTQTAANLVRILEHDDIKFYIVNPRDGIGAKDFERSYRFSVQAANLEQKVTVL